MEYLSLYREYHYMEDRYIGVPLYQIIELSIQHLLLS